MLLHESGSELGHICRIVVYLTDIRYRDAVYQEMGKWLKGVFPCSTGLVVPALARHITFLLVCSRRSMEAIMQVF